MGIAAIVIGIISLLFAVGGDLYILACVPALAGLVLGTIDVV